MTSFDFPDEYALVGESVTARATFFTEARGTGRIENGPWHAYLLPERTWIEPPHLPAGVVDLGPIAVEEQGDGRALASIAFIVPDVTTGPYTIGICNVPCTDSFLGDLGGDGSRSPEPRRAPRSSEGSTVPRANSTGNDTDSLNGSGTWSDLSRASRAGWTGSRARSSFG
jgi:hypothetical protein